MKTLNELGISPAPWQVLDDDRVLCTKSPTVYSVCNRGAYVGRNEWAANALLIAAAPELYTALRKLLIVAKNRMPSQPTVGEAEVMVEAEAALAKASGESEAAK